MSQLPDAANAMLPDTKITRYLLNPNHSLEAAGKAKFFNSVGFAHANWADLKQALLDHALANQVRSQKPNGFGENYVVSCSLRTPDGRNPCVDTVWFIDANDPTPRFVTAYPNP